MVGPDRSIQRLAVAHEDPERAAWAERLGEEYPPDPDQPMGVPNVIRTMTAEFVPEITDELLVEAAQGDERLLEIVRELGLRSAITVPLIARGRALGALSLIRDDSAPRYTELDLDLASELARRAASAVDNAGLYREASPRRSPTWMTASSSSTKTARSSRSIRRRLGYWRWTKPRSWARQRSARLGVGARSRTTRGPSGEGHAAR
jgi:transcriptional regulator with GAF, ATPase, and Fis domain